MGENIINKFKDWLKQSHHAYDKYEEDICYDDIDLIIDLIDTSCKEREYREKYIAYLEDYIRLLKNENDNLKRPKTMGIGK